MTDRLRSTHNAVRMPSSAPRPAPTKVAEEVRPETSQEDVDVLANRPMDCEHAAQSGRPRRSGSRMVGPPIRAGRRSLLRWRTRSPTTACPTSRLWRSIGRRAGSTCASGTTTRLLGGASLALQPQSTHGSRARSHADASHQIDSWLASADNDMLLSLIPLASTLEDVVSAKRTERHPSRRRS